MVLIAEDEEAVRFAMRSKNYYPLMLDLQDKPCVIIGGGAVAERKAESLIEAGASVTVISPVCTHKLVQWAESGVLEAVYETYRTQMPQVQRAVLVFAATDRPDINEAVRLEAEALGKLVNVADDAERSGFIVPAAVRRGRLLLAVSTAGASPAVARKVKQELEQSFGEEYGEYLELLQELRLIVQRMVSDTKVRQEMFRRMLDWELLPWIRSGELQAAEKDELIRRIELEPTPGTMERIRIWIQHHT
ncbi:bifunctional precorrin-2 dehydrogenase/sirohydrochlorin ferrochelatase [Paenibacillus sp. H1-7]|nr:bifunctional precorrin-2 dehydrogenase/sirohydrochlorin ferrochelatase [Paenibacillus sp. H1-7]